MIQNASESRTKKLIKNSAAGAVAFGIQIIITFISRVVFIRSLGIEYLGVNDLYINILSVLALADLGIETVLMYSLYAPIANHDVDLVSELVNVFKKLYRIIAAVILGLGVLLIPFLSFIIKDSGLTSSELTIYYLFFLGNSVCSYLMVYKSALLQADQNVHVVKLVKAFSQLICGFIQIILIVVFQNYIVYLITMVSTTLVNNLILNYKANKKYPFLSNTHDVHLKKEIKDKLVHNTKSMFLYKIGTTIINSTDNILISVVMGSVMVGYYSNYHTVTAAVTSIIGIFNASFIPGIGNYLASCKDGKSRLQLFSSTLLFYFIIATACSCVFIACFNQFIGLWVGQKYVLGTLDVIAIISCFYFQCIAHPMWMFRETSGLFNEIKPCILSMAALNIVFSYFLGKQYGIAGIIGATTLSRLLTLFWYEPKILYHKVFQKKSFDYWKKWILYFAVSVTAIALTTFLFVGKLETVSGMFIKGVLAGSLTLVFFFFAFSRTKEMQYLRSKLKRTRK